MSGSETISISGTPVRLKSTKLTGRDSLWISLPASSSMMNPGDADALGLAVHLDIQMAVFRQGQLVLGDLVALGQVGVKIVFPGKDRLRIDPAVGGQGHLQGVLHRLLVQHRQRPGHPQADLADLGVGRRPEGGGAAAKDLAGGEQMGMDFQPDDGLVFHFLPPGIIEGYPNGESLSRQGRRGLTYTKFGFCCNKFNC